jgi:hypothetical protein
VNVNNGGGGYYHGGVQYPVLTGMAIGAMAVTTGAVVGSYYHQLPQNCTTVIQNGQTYSHCGTAYYQQTWSGDDVVYQAVEQPY